LSCQTVELQKKRAGWQTISTKRYCPTKENDNDQEPVRSPSDVDKVGPKIPGVKKKKKKKRGGGGQKGNTKSEDKNQWKRYPKNKKKKKQTPKQKKKKKTKTKNTPKKKIMGV